MNCNLSMEISKVHIAMFKNFQKMYLNIYNLELVFCQDQEYILYNNLRNYILYKDLNTIYILNHTNFFHKNQIYNYIMEDFLLQNLYNLYIYQFHQNNLNIYIYKVYNNFNWEQVINQNYNHNQLLYFYWGQNKINSYYFSSHKLNIKIHIFNILNHYFIKKSHFYTNILVDFLQYHLYILNNYYFLIRKLNKYHHILNNLLINYHRNLISNYNQVGYLLYLNFYMLCINYIQNIHHNKKCML